MKIQLFKPHNGQLEVIRALEDPNIQYIVLNCGRRFGKSELALNVMTKFGLQNNDSEILYMTYKGDQRMTAWQDYNRLFGEAPFIRTNNKTYMNISFKTDSYLRFRLAAYPSVEAIRGKRFDLMILDEFALYRSDVWESILQPTLATARRKFKVLFMSTPRGKGLFYQLYKKGLDTNEKKWATIHMPSTANPLVNQEFIDDVRQQIPENIFRQEYLAEFLDDSGNLFENIETSIDDNPQESDQYYAGIDVGFTNDYTVLSIINEQGQLVYIDRFNQISMFDAATRLANALKRYNHPHCLIENNNYQGLCEMIEKLGVYNIDQHFTTSSNKKNMIEHLLNLFQTKALTILSDADLISELQDFTYSYNPKTRNISYAAPSGLHDDTVISIALAHFAKKEHAPFNISFAR